MVLEFLSSIITYLNVCVCVHSKSDTSCLPKPYILSIDFANNKVYYRLLHTINLYGRTIHVTNSIQPVIDGKKLVLWGQKKWLCQVPRGWAGTWTWKRRWRHLWADKKTYLDMRHQSSTWKLAINWLQCVWVVVCKTRPSCQHFCCPDYKLVSTEGPSRREVALLLKWFQGVLNNRKKGSLTRRGCFFEYKQVKYC